MNGKEIDGRAINVDKSTGKKSTGNDRGFANKPASNPSETLFIGNLSFDVDEDSVRDAFSAHGEIVSVRIPTDRETGRVKG